MTWRRFLLPDRGGAEGGAPLTGQGWTATVRGLHVFSAALLSLAFLTALLAGRDHAAVIAVAVLAAGYALVGARAIGTEADGRAVTYLLLLVVVLGVVAWDDPSLLFLLTLAYPQVWFLTEAPRPGLIWTGVLAAASTGGLLVHVAHHHGSSLAAVGDSAVGLVFSIAMGLWVGRVLEQSRQRAVLIAELGQTRAALAVAHHGQGVAAERERLAREVHDTIAQGWTSIVVLAQTAEAELTRAPERVRERLTLIADVARDNLAETRAIVAAFSPPALDDGTLVEALRRLGDRFARETGLCVEVETAAIPAGLRRDEEVVLLRAAQEACSNARRHAGATHVRLALAVEGGDVVVRVTDDGVGFRPGAAVGLGLTGLDARVREAGGALQVDSAPGQGTVLAARLPGPAVPST